MHIEHIQEYADTKALIIAESKILIRANGLDGNHFAIRRTNNQARACRCYAIRVAEKVKAPDGQNQTDSEIKLTEKQENNRTTGKNAHHDTSFGMEVIT